MEKKQHILHIRSLILVIFHTSTLQAIEETGGDASGTATGLLKKSQTAVQDLQKDIDTLNDFLLEARSKVSTEERGVYFGCFTHCQLTLFASPHFLFGGKHRRCLAFFFTRGHV